jgi:hypothetical protein
MRTRVWESARIAAAIVCAIAALGATPAHADAYALTKIVLSGESEPVSGGTFDPNFFFVSLNESGHVAFPAQLTVGESFSFGVFAHRDGGLEAVALRGEPAPECGNGTYGYVGGTSQINDAGDVSFMASIIGGELDTEEPTDLGLFLDSEGVHSPVVLANETAPAPPGGSYTPSTSDLDRHGLANSGAVAFLSGISSGSATSGIFAGTGSSETPLALEGNPTPAGGDYDAFRFPGGGPSGHVVFVADVVTGPADIGIFRYLGAAGSSIALSGGDAPGTEEGTFTDFYYPAVNASGDVVFLASADGSVPQDGIFVSLAGILWPVAIENDPAPETSGGSITSVPFPPAIAGDGDVVFPAGITGGSVSAAVYRYAAASKSLSPIVFADDIAPLTDGASFVSFGVVAANGAGEVAFQATLSDGRHGIFLASSADAVPSVGTSGLAALALFVGGLGLFALRRLT